MTIAGLKLIVPTSATATGAGSSASVSATGKVTFTSAVTTSVNGCFTSTYDNYLVVVRTKDTIDGQGFELRLRVGGSDASGSNYVFQQMHANNTTVAGSRTTGQTKAQVMLTSDTTYGQGTHLYFYQPALAQPTLIRGVSATTFSSVASLYDYVATHSLSTAYDGFTLLNPNGNSTGALTIYGFSQ